MKAQEIYNTEKSYVAGLADVVEVHFTFARLQFVIEQQNFCSKCSLLCICLVLVGRSSHACPHDLLLS